MRLLCAAAVLVLATGCGGAVGETSSWSAPPPVELTATDLAFMELVIPQNESTLAAVALAATKPGSTQPALIDQVESEYRDELVDVRDLLAKAGRPETDQHQGHDMPGMVTAVELETLGNAGSTGFDRQLRAVLRTQFEEARTVARAGLSSGTAKPVLELGARIERTRTELLALLGTP
jgi:hypothetical protein